MDSKKKGNLTELQCLAAFVECGCGVSIPYGDNSKYDFIADKNEQLLICFIYTKKDIPLYSKTNEVMIEFLNDIAKKLKKNNNE